VKSVFSPCVDMYSIKPIRNTAFVGLSKPSHQRGHLQTLARSNSLSRFELLRRSPCVRGSSPGSDTGCVEI